MVERSRVGLVFSYNEKWIAGAYYILNIIHALKTLDDSEKPKLIILSDSKKNYDIVLKETAYPYLEYQPYPFTKPVYSVLDRVINKLSRLFFGKNSIVKRLEYPEINMLYPSQINGLSDTLKKVNWIPDFQEDYLPHYFSEKEIKKRKESQKNIIAKGDVVVISSNDAKSDFMRLYPNSNAKIVVLPFAVTHPDFSKEKIETLLLKYDLPSNYFFAPNQFWAHKNHIVLLKAVNQLKKEGFNLVVAMSGKEDDYRNADNFEKLKRYVSTNNLESHVKFLGFLPRNEQLCLFKNTTAIIQPSLFEGWSTVVEDAKALNKFVILSNLNVHKEQLKENMSFFDPNNYIELSECIKSHINLPLKMKDYNYENHVIDFGKRFNELIRISKN